MPIFVNKRLIESFNFPGGECSVQLPNDSVGLYCTDVIANLNNSDDIMKLLLTIDAIRRIQTHTKIYLSIPYFPYARQDRVCNPGEALSVKVMADLINSLNCFKVKIFDPHSEVTPALLNNCTVYHAWHILFYGFPNIFEHANVVISPDAGSEKKIREIAKNHKDIKEIIYATKVRDTATGVITATEVFGDVSGKNVIIIDDICDGGRTFIELSKVLSDKGCNEKYLYVTHGIFSKGLDELKQHFTKIFCFHTILPKDKIDRDFLTTGREYYDF